MSPCIAPPLLSVEEDVVRPNNCPCQQISVFRICWVLPVHREDSEWKLTSAINCNWCHLQACAPSQLPLQARLDMNMARLHELDSERLGAYGWVGGLVVMVELRHRVLLLRETLNLPPCDPLADLDKVPSLPDPTRYLKHSDLSFAFYWETELL